MRESGPWRITWLSLSVLIAIVCPEIILAADDDIDILTFPIGVVAGTHPIDTNVGKPDGRTELLLDGEHVCTFAAGATRCVVDLGAAPRVRLLELVRRDESGRITATARRWLNRPGQEAELDLKLELSGTSETCSGRVVWFHPAKMDPSLLEIEFGGSRVHLVDDGSSFQFRCPASERGAPVTASAVFPDGARAEAVATVGARSEVTNVDLTAVPLVGRGTERVDCGGLITRFEERVAAVESAGAEVVFVLDPSAGYRRLLASPGAEVQRGTAWRRAEASLFDVDRIWFVMPNQDLFRIDGFSSGSTQLKGFGALGTKSNWLRNLFKIGTAPFEGKHRLADAVAASGLVAAAGPRRRSVVLILGNEPTPDLSQFTALQAQRYLAEVGVPLVVLRTGKPRDDGWPLGVRLRGMDSLARALHGVKQGLDRQCVVWFEGDQRLGDVAASLPEGIEIAGWLAGVEVGSGAASAAGW